MPFIDMVISCVFLEPLWRLGTLVHIHKENTTLGVVTFLWCATNSNSVRFSLGSSSGRFADLQTALPLFQIVWYKSPSDGRLG